MIITSKKRVAKTKAIEEIPKSNTQMSTFDSYVLQNLDHIDTKFETKLDHINTKIEAKIDSNFKWLLSMMFAIVILRIGLYLK